MYEQWEGGPGRLAQSASGIVSLTREKFHYYYKEHFSPLLLLTLAGVLVALRWRRRRSPQRANTGAPTFALFGRRWGQNTGLFGGPGLLALTFLLVSCGLFSVVWPALPAYPAPLLVSFFGLSMLGIRYLRAALRTKSAIGLYWTRGIMAGLLLFSLGMLCSNTLRGLKHSVEFPLKWNLERARVLGDLERRGGKHLVLVKFFRGHPIHEEWVYNSPNIDQQKVIVARTMGAAEDCRLIRHYAQRQVWLVEPDANNFPTVLMPYADWPLAPQCQHSASSSAGTAAPNTNVR
jgi:hypothetical protein